MACEFYRSPVGILRIISDGEAITEISISEEGISENDELTVQTVEQLREYFEGKRQKFSLPLKPEGTLFQQRVWKVLAGIPYGEALTYGQVAELAGYAKAYRAVGNAVGKNPILIAIPCHRVKAANGLGGFSAGIENKKFLVALENIII